MADELDTYHADLDAYAAVSNQAARAAAPTYHDLYSAWNSTPEGPARQEAFDALQSFIDREEAPLIAKAPVVPPAVHRNRMP